VWILGIQSYIGSSHIPESIRVAFGSFSDIRNPGSYTAPDGSSLPKDTDGRSDDTQFNLTKWWEIRDGETMGEPFDVRGELVEELLRALRTVRNLC
jgi:hypothetical protein